jgi:O-antigen/teichoic acid export membrane protein
VSDALEPLPDSDGGSVPLGFKRNVLTNYGNAIVLMVVALFTTPLLTHGLGPERYGIWAMVGSIIPYLEILELGFASTTIVMLARHMASGDSKSAQAILNTSLFLLIVPGLVCFGLACGIAVILPHVVSIPPSQVPAARTLVILLGIDMAFSIPSDTFGGGLIALQRWDLLNVTLVAVILGQALSWFIVIRLGGGLIALGLVTVGVSLVGQVARFVIFRRLLPDLKITAKSFDRHLVRSFAGLSGWFSVSQLTLLALDTIDVVIVGAIEGVAKAGIYAVGLRLSTLASNAVTPVTGLFAPASAHTIGRGDGDKLSSMVVTGNRVATSIAIPAALVTAVLARPALRSWVGPLYLEAAVVVVLLSASVVVQSSAATSRSVLFGAAEPRLPTVFGVAGLIVHVALAVVLGRRYGIDGVASAVLIASILFDGIAMMFLTSRRYGVKIPAYLALLVRAHILPIMCSGAVGLYLTLGPLWNFVQTHPRPVSVLAVIASGLVMLAIYFSIYAYTGLSASERQGVVGRIRALRRRRR